MKDLLGQEVSVGDTVCIAQPKGYQKLKIALVQEVGPNWVKVKGNAQRKYSCLKSIDLEYLQQLEEESHKLSCLEAAGVDNWDGYDYAMDMMNEEEEPEDE